MGTIDNIYVLNYVINKYVSKKERLLALFFVGLRAAFDSVDRTKLLNSMREREVREGLVERCGDVLRETIFRVRVGEELGKEFWTGKGSKAEVPIKPGSI